MPSFQQHAAQPSQSSSIANQRAMWLDQVEFEAAKADAVRLIAEATGIAPIRISISVQSNTETS